MPQIEKGGKYIFGWSRIRLDGSVYLPDEARQEYHIEPGGRVILISGSKTSGGFCVATKALLQASTVAGILAYHPELAEYRLESSRTVRFKGRLYGWAAVQADGCIALPALILQVFAVKPGNDLLIIRGSNLAFVLAAKGPLVEVARRHAEIPVFE